MTRPSEAELIEARESLLAFRHGDRSHLTSEHARILFAALTRAEGGKRWRHKKRGSTYVEIGRGKMQVAADSSLLDEEPIVIYRSEQDGSLWARPVTDFEDGRFEALTAPSQPASARELTTEEAALVKSAVISSSEHLYDVSTREGKAEPVAKKPFHGRFFHVTDEDRAECLICQGQDKEWEKAVEYAEAPPAQPAPAVDREVLLRLRTFIAPCECGQGDKLRALQDIDALLAQPIENITAVLADIANSPEQAGKAAESRASDMRLAAWARATSRGVYLVCEKEIADDISPKLLAVADRLESLSAGAAK